LYIGNDIIALKESFNSSSFSNARYYNKISDIAERDLLVIVENNASALLWSLKESAYKLCSKMCTPIPFNPKHFRLIDIAEKNLFLESKVEFVNNQLVFQGKTFICDDYLHSWLMPLDQDQSKLKSEVFAFESSDEEQNSYQIKQILRKKLAGFYGLNARKIKLQKDRNGIPFVTLEGRISPDISLSHDGEYAAYTFVY